MEFFFGIRSEHYSLSFQCPVLLLASWTSLTLGPLYIVSFPIWKLAGFNSVLSVVKYDTFLERSLFSSISLVLACLLSLDGPQAALGESHQPQELKSWHLARASTFLYWIKAYCCLLHTCPSDVFPWWLLQKHVECLVVTTVLGDKIVFLLQNLSYSSRQNLIWEKVGEVFSVLIA